MSSVPLLLERVEGQAPGGDRVAAAEVDRQDVVAAGPVDGHRRGGSRGQNADDISVGIDQLQRRAVQHQTDLGNPGRELDFVEVDGGLHGGGVGAGVGARLGGGRRDGGGVAQDRAVRHGVGNHDHDGERGRSVMRSDAAVKVSVPLLPTPTESVSVQPVGVATGTSVVSAGMT